MGLGGITRDSILDLQALVHDDANNNNNNNKQQLSGSFNSGKKNDFSSLLNEPPPDLLDNSSSNEGKLKRVESFKEPLNDTPLTSPAVAGMANSIDGLLINGNGIPTSPSAGLSLPPAAATTSSNTSSNNSSNNNNNSQQQKKKKKKKKNVSSTNSRSLDSYNTTKSNNYSNFQYEGYTDYYNEAEYGGSYGGGYGYDDMSSSRGSMDKQEGSRPGSNLLSCLFPWIGTPKQDEQKKILDTQQSSSSDGSISLPSSLKEAELDKEEARQHAVNEEAAAQSVAAAAGVSTLSSSTSSTPSSPKIPMKKQIQTPSSNKPPTPGKEVTFAKSMSPPKATIPHMMSVDSTSTAHSTSTSSAEDLTAAGILVGESIVEDEKKQEEGDNTAVLPTNFPKVPDLDVKDTTSTSTITAEQLAKEAEKEELPQFKSILKVRRCSISLLNAKPKTATTTTKKEVSSDGKRHFLPTYEPKKSPVHSLTGDPISNNNTNPKSINFNPMARVLTIPSRKDVPLHQKAQVWWQRSDYDEFKKTGRIISKAMECGGSEIWLASSNAWGKAGAKRGSSGSGSPRKVQGTPGAPESETKLERSNSDSSKSSQSELLEKSEIEYNKSLSRYVKEDKDTDSDGEGGDNPNKWWCKFGHSRRGLEHIASSSEGRARQQSVLLAIRMVMEEQKRQRASRTKDPNKLRNVSMQYTSWARDLSLAAGAADHEAVESGFDPQASDRARHFAKRISNFGSTNDESSGMLTHSHKVAVAVASQILDANTHATPRTAARKKAQTKSLGDIAAADSDTTSLSKRAKGFMPGGNDTSAAEMMAGMGNVPQPRRSVKV